MEENIQKPWMMMNIKTDYAKFRLLSQLILNKSSVSLNSTYTHKHACCCGKYFFRRDFMQLILNHVDFIASKNICL
jgi:hypothetical protein